MKKIVISITILILAVLGYSCSKDHDAPTFSQFEIAKKPTNVVASYNKTAGSFTVTWAMASTKDVIDYYVTIADSANFTGQNTTRPVGSAVTTCTIKASDIGIPATATTAVRYFTVSAIYSNANLKTFVGPQCDVADSAMYVK